MNKVKQRSRRDMLVTGVVLLVTAAVTALLAVLSSADYAATAADADLAEATPCPIPTQEPLWVDPVTSPTDDFTQTVTVYLGNGEAVTVTAESGTFATSGDFSVYANPALVTMTLLPSATHHLEVAGRVRVVEWGGCIYGGYTLHTTLDRYGDPLLITQLFTVTANSYLPLVFMGGPARR